MTTTTVQTTAAGTDLESGLRHRLMGSALGVRPGHGEDARVIRLSARAGLRSSLNRLIPVLSVALVIFLLGVEKFLFRENYGPAAAAWRVFVIDFVVFLFGSLSGWNMVRLWRENPNQVEELSLSPLPPKVVAATFTAGPVAAWAVVLLAVGVFDLVTPALPLRGLLAMAEGGADPTLFFGGVFMPFLLHLLAVPLLLVFHFESARLAHWMFVIHAVPRISLRRAGLLNLLAASGIVTGLSALGGAMTMLVFFFLVIVLMVLGVESAGDSLAVWQAAILPALAAVAVLKRQMTRIYESSFQRAWLLFQWSGAGESRQPDRHAAHYYDILPFWEAYYAMLEEKNAGIPLHRSSATRRFEEILARIETERRAHEAALRPAEVQAPPVDSVG